MEKPAQRFKAADGKRVLVFRQGCMWMACLKWVIVLLLLTG